MEKINIKNMLAKAIQLHQNGKLFEAKKIYQEIILIDKRNFQAIHFSGIIEAIQENYTEAIELFTRAIKLNPTDPFALCNRSNALNSSGKHYEALLDIDKALLLNQNNCTSLAIKGNILFNLCKYNEAEIVFRKILSLDSDSSDALTNLANTQKEQGNFEEAIANYNRSLAINPNSYETYLNLGIAFMNKNSLNAAKTYFDTAVILNNNPAAHYYLGLIYEKMCDIANAIKEITMASDAGNLPAIWCLPFIKASLYNAEVELYDAKLQLSFNNDLNNSYQIIKNFDITKKIDIVGSRQPFDFSYRLENNREVFSNYGQICINLMTELQNKIPFIINTENKEGKIKIAIIGEHIRNHSVWNIITKGIITIIDKELFELHIYHLGNIFDEETDLAIELCKKYNNGYNNVEEWANKLINDGIQVIIYPELGMHKLTTQLATLRLAKLQLAFWGHPETTGFSTIDYFVSSELIEPHNYLNNYTEKVLLLPDLGCYFTPPKTVSKKITKSSLGIEDHVPILLCPGVSFKYESNFDKILVQIAKTNQNVCFMFFESNEYKTEYLRKRLFNIFKENQLSNQQIIFRPWPDLDELYGIMSISTLCLDTVVHSGFNTAISCIECLLPQITYEGDFFRNRQAAAILRRIGVSDTIACSIDDYVDKVNSLVNENLHLNSIKEKIKYNRNVLYNNTKPIRYLEKFIIDYLNAK